MLSAIIRYQTTTKIAPMSLYAFISYRVYSKYGFKQLQKSMPLLMGGTFLLKTLLTRRNRETMDEVQRLWIMKHKFSRPN